MPIDNDEDSFNSAFHERLRAARDAVGLKQSEVAEALNIPLERYKKYEQRSQMPLYLIGPFCELTGEDLAYLLTGKRQGPSIAPRPSFDRRRR